jgi:hypothetical protein
MAKKSSRRLTDEERAEQRRPAAPIVESPANGAFVVLGFRTGSEGSRVLAKF